MGIPIGIDLGTTYSAIAGWKETSFFTGPDVYTIPLEGQSQHCVASKIYIPNLNNKDSVQFGRLALKKSFVDPERFHAAFKRGMDTNAAIRRPDGEITPVELSSMLLEYLIRDNVIPVEGDSFVPEGVVVSVPYYFTDNQSQRTRIALTNALKWIYGNNPDVNVDKLDLKTVAEPIAAGLDYAFMNEMDLEKQNVLIFDLGGGTFDMTIYELKNIRKLSKLEFTVLATDGDSRLGGEDFDVSIRKFLLDKGGVDDAVAYDKKYKTDMAALSALVTEAKCVLSNKAVESESITMASFFGCGLFDYPLTRADIEKVMRGEAGERIDYISRIDDIVERCLMKSQLASKQIDRIVLVGGSSNMPCVRRILEDKFGCGKIINSKDASLSVARGASIWAAYKLDEINKNNPDYKKHLHYWDEIIIKEKTPHSIGVLTRFGVDPLVPSNSFTPFQATRVYSPSKLSSDGSKAVLDAIVIKQGDSEIGTIPMPDIYAHGRSCKNIPVKVTLIAESTSISVLVHIPKGHEDGTDINEEGQIQIS